MYAHKLKLRAIWALGQVFIYYLLYFNPYQIKYSTTACNAVMQLLIAV